MGKLGNFLSGMQVLEEIDSPINGKLTVVKSIAFGTYIQAANLTQSGGILYGVWKKPLKKVKGEGLKVKDCLVVGLGGGTVVKLIKEFWPDAKIVGIELDPLMIDLGKKYLNLKNDVEIKMGDGLEIVKKAARKKEKYDLVLVDTYVGDEFPKNFESDEFITLVKKLLNKKGRAVFNRLYYGEKRSQARRFGDRLEKHFGDVEIVYPEANVMFICK